MQIRFFILIILSILVPLPDTRAEDDVHPEAPITADDRDHWSFRPLTRPAVPNVNNNQWPHNSIDRFVLSKLEANKLSPMPEADRVTLIRRLTFDLTGLPPNPEEVNAFLNDHSDNAYERLVERLLASSAYGERWAQHWLDLARFAETDGFEHDKVRPNAWRYRDWVIQALNNDMPYNEFLGLQLAGDEIRPGDPDAAIATGFLLCGPDMPDINLQEERKHIFLNDMTSTVSSVFLGLQFECAQCHNHKYDPISQLDFYRMRAFFENADLFTEKPIPTQREIAFRKSFELERAERWQQITNRIEQFEDGVLERIRNEQNKPKLELSLNELKEKFTAEEKQKYEKLTQALDAVKKQRPPALSLGRVLREPSPRVKPNYLYVRGDFRRRGPKVLPAFPRIVNYNNAHVLPPRRTDTSSRRRTALMSWMIQPNHPLTTRVIVNRLWQAHFGRGLSVSASDFGIMGDDPTHPELLDWLATELPRWNWSLKAMHRLLVTSATYRQSSRPSNPRWNEEQNRTALAAWSKSKTEDPDNDLFSRMNRQRLEGEAIRDAMLVASEDLSRRRGGPGVRPPLPKELLVTLLKNQWPVTKNKEDHDRRSIYLFVRRNLRYPIFDVFDKPDTNASCPRRNRSTIAPQALMLLNSDASLSAARRLSGYLMKHAPANKYEQIELCYLRTLSRKPTEAELSTALRFLADDEKHLRKEGRKSEELALPENLPQESSTYAAAALTDFCLAVFNLNEFLYID